VPVHIDKLKLLVQITAVMFTLTSILKPTILSVRKHQSFNATEIKYMRNFKDFLRKAVSEQFLIRLFFSLFSLSTALNTLP